MKNNGISEDIYNGKPQRTKSQLDKVPIFQNVSRTSGSLRVARPYQRNQK
jgi:hypothetical protein